MSIRWAIVALALTMFAGCAGTGTYRADRAKVENIHSVALVGFTMPWRVGVDKESNNPSTLSPFMRKKFKGNGDDAAPAVLAGFLEGMSKQPNWKLKPSDLVAINVRFAELMSDYDQAQNLVYNKSGVRGIPVIPLKFGTEKMEFAQKAAAVLGVDGVILVDFTELYYFLYTGTMGNGQAKAHAAVTFNLFDKTGQSVWEAVSVANSEESAGMALGIVTNNTSGLHKSAGAAVAADLIKVYQEQGVTKK